ncbi:MAG: DUF2384 domain-containing protein [Acidobacteriota bacterium]|nr:DUF2384 domain-containing protein [Acidobacteriota bacterium]
MHSRVSAARRGVTVDEAIATMRAWSIPAGRFAAILGCSERKWSRVRAGDRGSRLSPTESDRLLRTQRLFEHARSVFDEDKDARAWLSAPNDALSGESPLALLDTDAGARLVDDVLTRLEFGVYA